MATSKPRSGENVSLDPSTKGMISNASHYVLDTSSWSYLENMHDDKLGVLRTRPYIQEAFTTTNGYQGIGFYESGSTSYFWLKSGIDLIIASPETPGTTTTIAGFFNGASAIARFAPIQNVMVTVSPGMIPKVTNSSGTLINTISFPANVGIVQAGFAGRIWGVPTFSSSSSTWKWPSCSPGR